MSEVLSGLFTHAGWIFLPGYVTSLIQTLYYRLTIRAGRPSPQPGHPHYAQHHRRIRVFVLCLYLVYSLVQTLHDARLAGDFYIALGVTPSSSDREIKARFRRLAAKYHPDKVRDTSGDPVNEAAFVSLKLAQDTLLEPVKRFAYDHFGPVVVRLQHPTLESQRDYVYIGFRSLLPEYLKTITSLVVLNYFWLSPWGQYWKYLSIASLVYLECYFLTHSWAPPIHSYYIASFAHNSFPGIFPAHLLPFQILGIARRMLISISIFISQLAPPAAQSKAPENHQTLQQIAHLNQAAIRMDAEAAGLLDLGLAPFKGDEEKVALLRRGMKESIVLNTVRGTPEVKEAVGRVLDRRKEQVS